MTESWHKSGFRLIHEMWENHGDARNPVYDRTEIKNELGRLKWAIDNDVRELARRKRGQLINLLVFNRRLM